MSKDEKVTWDISSVEFRDGRMFYGIEMSPEMIGAKAFYLIENAPELLDALQHLTLLIRNMVDLYGVPQADWLMKQNSFINAEAAISKATGQAEKVSA